MRAFLALPVTPPAFDQGVRLVERLCESIAGVRWVRPEGLHVTLHFFASLGDDAAATVVDAARAAARDTAPYRAQLGGLGCFPREGDERVLWMGMLQGEAETAALQRATEGALAQQGFPVEQRRFRPHVTLGRPRQRFSDAERRRWAGFAAEALPPFAVEEVRLYRSHPGPGGSRYEVLESVPLGGVSAAR